MRNDHNGLAGKYRRLYKIWWGMLERCRPDGRKHYGFKGIRVCDEWLDFSRFVAWALENGYDECLSIDRIDNDMGYEPSNCRWASKKQQARNRSTNVLFEHRGEKKTLAEWAEEHSMKYLTLVTRVVRKGWSLQQALNTPVQIKDELVAYKGRTMLVSEHAKELGITRVAMRLRLRRMKRDVRVS